MLSDIYKKNPTVVKRKIADELILVPTMSSIAEQQKIFSLNEVGEYVYDRLDGSSTLQEILDSLMADFDVSREVAEVDVLQFVDAVLQQGLISKQD
jgi:hypothetical protein